MRKQHKPKLVVIEDEPDVARLFQIIGENAGFDVTCVDSTQALILSWEGVTHAIIDYMMPNINGETYLRTLKILHPEVKRILCSAANPPAEVRELADVFIPKPVSFSDLENALTKGRIVPGDHNERSMSKKTYR